mmetsp:Transcript_23725/g.66669  ORF Transcript_23725/g.66669 Transcript_23725/m.66669 type:complete len:299 (-) Transcript_23725:483-1379(-)
MNGATAFRSPTMTRHIDKEAQNNMALRGSAPSEGAKCLRIGTRSSLPSAASKRGAPAKDWRPAPNVESKTPTTTIISCGQARSFTTKRGTRGKSSRGNSINASLRTAPPATTTTWIENTIVVTITAAMVPGGIDACGSFKSPDKLEPARGSVTAGKNNARHALKDHSTPAFSLYSDMRFLRMFSPDTPTIPWRGFPSPTLCTITPAQIAATANNTPNRNNTAKRATYSTPTKTMTARPVNIIAPNTRIGRSPNVAGKLSCSTSTQPRTYMATPKVLLRKSKAPVTPPNCAPSEFLTMA